MTRLAAIAAVGVGISVLIGWQADIGLLKSVLPGLVAMNPSTALAFIAAGIALWLLAPETRTRPQRLLAAALATAVLATGMSKLISLALSLDLGIDQILFADKLSRYPVPNRMAPNTALNLVLLGLALLSLLDDRTAAARLRQALACLVLLIGLLPVIGYAYAESALTGVPSSVQMALHTAIVFCLLAGGVLAARPEYSIMSILGSQGPGGGIARRLLATVVLLPIILGWLCLQGEGLYGARFGTAFLVVCLTTLLMVLVLYTAISVDAIDAERAEILDRKRQIQAESLAAKTLQSILTGAPVALASLDLKGQVTTWNRAAEELFGWTEEEVRGKPSPIISEHPILLQTTLERMRRGGPDPHLEITGQRKDGSPLELCVSFAPLTDSKESIVGIMAAFDDISVRKQLEGELRHRALHDPLTDLPNRTLLYERLDRSIIRSRRSSRSFALLLLDLDHFKEINDTFGHQYGDILLQQLGSRLQNLVRESDTVARLGGDEFAVIVEDADEEAAVAVADKLASAVIEPFGVDGLAFRVDASIGITVCLGSRVTAHDLLRQADVAMYSAKTATTPHVVYRQEHDEHSADRMLLTYDLRSAVQNEQLMLHFQPKRQLRGGAAQQVEALLRWRHPTRGIIPPAEFIPLAEQLGLIETITAFVLERAIQEHCRWRDGGYEISIAVNLSAHTLRDPHILDVVDELLRRYSMSPGYLTLEVTETAVMSDPLCAMRTLGRLHDMGVRISVDDFGTGYSSLGYLRRLPVDEIKIDRSFVKDMTNSQDDALIVRSIIDLAHNLGLEVVAEGVEDHETVEALVRLGCDLAQGYYFSRPVPALDYVQWLQKLHDSRGSTKAV